MSTAPIQDAVTLREGSAFDIAMVMELMDAAFDAAFGEAWNTQQCLGILDMPGVWLILAAADGKPAGFALCRAILDEAELLLIGVAPRFRRRGIGQALLDRVIETAGSRDVHHLHLEVRQGNDAIALYHRNGFRQVGHRSNYYRGRDGILLDALSLTRALRSD
ncbi:ribosomal-protein-alanine acetyltransferase [Sphingomonas sp. DBB INV C78]|uniref:ribosomal protein S18-alanine N-acetyltransferase n=1 Tax=Sphingomonas sp. DBB INV C78 TaxID=3349434 RepID=UPI0036D3B1AA